MGEAMTNAMSKMRGWGRCLLIGALLALAPPAGAQDEGGMPPTLDQEFAQLAEKVPGFGGLYLDEKGTTHVYLQDLSRAREVQGLGERVEVQQGEYDFRDLFAWKEEVRPRLTQEGALSLDIDERRNRLVFGVKEGSLDAFAAELQSFLRSTRVPPEAVLVEAAEPIVPLELLTDRIRPVPMGVQISRPISSLQSAVCTLGVNATRFGVKGFVTNSHCTATRSAVEGSLFYQNNVGPFNFIGTETVDPPFFTNSSNSSCPQGKLCRWSDSAFVAYHSATFSDGGQLANPVFCGAGFPGPLQVSSAQPRLPVTGYIFGNPVVGSIVQKVGRTTGCTFGPQQSSCTDVNVLLPNGLLSNITMLCQNLVTASSGGGDSGSPVFWNEGDEAILVGILWGGASGTYAYSPWFFVHLEIVGVMPDAP